MEPEGSLTAFTSACHLSLSWARSIQSMPPHPTSEWSILILSSHLHLGLPSGLLPSGFLTKTLYTHMCYMPHSSHLSCFNYPNNIGWGIQIIKLFIMWFSLFPCYLVPLMPKYSPQHPILKHPQPTFLPHVRDQVSHPYKTTGKILDLYILIFKFFW